jgi:hypothetical protein
MLELFELFIELSGASRVLDKILKQIEPQMAEIEKKVYPTVLKLEAMERRWEAVEGTLSTGQRGELEGRGYTLLDRAQFGRLYGRRRSREWTVTDEALLEEDIRRMASVDAGTNGRSKREAGANSTVPEEIFSLRPFLYTNKLRQNAAVAVNGVVLSPRAFATTLSSPNFMWVSAGLAGMRRSMPRPCSDECAQPVRLCAEHSQPKGSGPDCFGGTSLAQTHPFHPSIH